MNIVCIQYFLLWNNYFIFYLVSHTYATDYWYLLASYEYYHLSLSEDTHRNRMGGKHTSYPSQSNGKYTGQPRKPDISKHWISLSDISLQLYHNHGVYHCLRFKSLFNMDLDMCVYITWEFCVYSNKFCSLYWFSYER